MKYLYEEFYQKNRGVSEKDYQTAIEKFAGKPVDELFKNYVHGTRDYTSILNASFETVGLKLNKKPNEKISQSKLGVKTVLQGNYMVVKGIHPNSPAELSGLMLEDEIIAVNSMDATGNVDVWLSYYKQDPIELLIRRKGIFISKNIEYDSLYYYPDYFVTEIEKLTEEQKKLKLRWAN